MTARPGSVRFGAQLEAFRRRATGNIDNVRRGVALRLFRAVILDSPVRTGRLRANWQCSINIPDRTVTPYTDTNGGDTINKVHAEVKESGLNDVLILTNSLPYAARIEYDGWSHTKAPEGMVRINVIRFKRLLGEEAKLVLSGGANT